eukprot:785731-Pelagomonas_calceolata.AAC.2
MEGRKEGNLQGMRQAQTRLQLHSHAQVDVLQELLALGRNLQVSAKCGPEVDMREGNMEHDWQGSECLTWIG